MGHNLNNASNTTSRSDSTLTKAPMISSIFCPIDSRIAPDAELIQQFTNDWACRFHFLPSELAVKRFAKGKFANLAARAYVGADKETIELMSCWLSFTFFLDDQCERLSDPEQLQSFFTRFMTSLQTPAATTTTETNATRGPLFEALSDLWSSTVTRCNGAWSQRLAKDLSDYFDGYRWEAGNRLRNRVPPLKEYLHYRQYTVAIYFFLDLYSLAHGIDLSEEDVHNLPELAELTHSANNLIAWFNDIISLEKELAEKDMHNLVLVIQNEDKCTLQEAMDRAVEMHNMEMVKFLELERKLQARLSGSGKGQLSAQQQKLASEVSRYLNGLRSCIRGNLDWSYESGRYVTNGSKPEDLVIAYFTPKN